MAVETTSPASVVTARPLSARWRKAVPPLRTVVAATLAYVLAAAIHLPEGYWAALSAIVVSRPQPGAAVQAGADRFVGTLLGAALACGVSFGRLWNLPDVLLLAVTLVPLGILAAWREGYRTAPIAAVIVLSAQGVGQSAIDVGLLRIATICLGAVVGMGMSWVLLPTHSEREADALSREAFDALRSALAAAGAADWPRCETLQAAARLRLVMLARLAGTARWERSDGAVLERLRSTAGRLNLSVGFVVRTMEAAQHRANPILASDALRDRIEAFMAAAGTTVSNSPQSRPVTEQASAPEPSASWAEVCRALPSAHHRQQAQALGYALGMALRDATELAGTLHIA
jgi:uncharacterized membrane protein YccC